MQENVILVKAANDIHLRQAWVSQNAHDQNPYRQRSLIWRGTIGIIDGESKLGCEYKVVSFERAFSKGFVTDSVRVENLVEI